MGNVLYILIGVAAVIAAVFIALRFFRQAKLPILPPWGPMPLGELTKYYGLPHPALAWEKVRGWDLNEAPASFDAPVPIEHAILTPRLLEFCSIENGRLTLAFNFLVGAILNVHFDPEGARTAGAPPDVGLVTVYTPSGRTFFLASSAFAKALQDEVARARQ